MRPSFIGKVLRSVSENYRTADEILKIYNRKNPPGILTILLPVTRAKITTALEILVKHGYVERDVTRFIEEGLDHDEPEYRLGNKGRIFLIKGKKS